MQPAGVNVALYAGSRPEDHTAVRTKLELTVAVRLARLVQKPLGCLNRLKATEFSKVEAGAILTRGFRGDRR